MSRIPLYAYRVVVHVEIAGGKRRQEQHNYNTFAGAVAYREIALRKRFTRKVEVLMVIDETTKEGPVHSS